MKVSFRMIGLFAVTLSVLAAHASAAGTGVANLVKPIAPPAPLETIVDDTGKRRCGDGLVLQKDGRCCPKGTNNGLWPNACTPVGTIDDQIFNYNDIPHYCPSADMFIVSDKNWKWFSCADNDSTPLYPAAKETEGSKFCMKHGYGYLLKIKPWGTVGCVKVGDSQGDGCIEAGTCSFGGE
jgi:hypothetical protein